MAWIYLAALEGSRLAWLPGSDQSPIVNTIDTAKACSYPECGKARCHSLPSGTTCKHSKDRSSTHGLISFTEGFRARISVLQALEKAWEESEAVFFTKSSDCVASYDRSSSSWRTSQQSLLVEDATWSGPLPRWGMTAGGALYPLPKLVPIINENGGFYWPTPTVAGNYNRKGSSRASGDGLATAVNLYLTPTASNTKAVHLRSGGRAPRSYFPTPAARDYKSGKGRQENGHTPQLPEVIGGQLNPAWVEWLMGYPAGWTELSAWAMPWFHSRRGQRSKSSVGSRGEK